MPIVQLEHAIHDFDAWKVNFDFDPIRREESGVKRYRILRPVDDANYVIVELEFDEVAEAEKFRGALQQLWTSPMAQAALASDPSARVIETYETKEY